MYKYIYILTIKTQYKNVWLTCQDHPNFKCKNRDSADTATKHKNILSSNNLYIHLHLHPQLHWGSGYEPAVIRSLHCENEIQPWWAPCGFGRFLSFHHNHPSQHSLLAFTILLTGFWIRCGHVAADASSCTKKKKKPLDISHPYCRQKAPISAPKISLVCLANIQQTLNLKIWGDSQRQKKSLKGLWKTTEEEQEVKGHGCWKLASL